MKRRIPVSIGYHSGVQLPDAMLEFNAETDVEERFVEAMVDGAEFTVSISARRRDPGQNGSKFIIEEIRFLPIPKLKRET